MVYVPLLRSTLGLLVAIAVLLSVPDGAAALQLRAAAANRATAKKQPPSAPEPAPPVPAVAQASGHHGAITDDDKHPFAMTYHTVHYELVPLGAAVLLYGVTCCVVLVAAVLMVCCMYDAAAHWCHRAHFHSCQNKVQRVHEVFLRRKGEQLLCPYCVEFISNSSRSSGPVVFLCGHRFHMDCANKWFREQPDKAGRCPMCEAITCGSGAKTNKSAASATVTGPTNAARTDNCCGEAAMTSVDSTNDEALSFILGSLHRTYPAIIKEENVARWSSCHTEIWLSELRCPRYNSILHKHK